jgi:hypothetical protein
MEQGSAVSVDSTVGGMATVEVAFASTSVSVGTSVTAAVAGGFPQLARMANKNNTTK